MKKRIEDKTVLVVDDDDMNLQVAKMVLERKIHCRVIISDNGRDALEILRGQDVNLVLLDIMMPDFDGIETLAQIRADEFFGGVPVMMLTASGDVDDIRRAAALGVTDYIKKPFMPADLADRVTKKLNAIDEYATEKILLVGENRIALKDMRRTLEDSFLCDVSIAVSIAEAVEILRGGEFNLIIACADMKFIDGFRLMKFLADDRFSAVPLVLTTPEAFAEMLAKISAADNIDAEPAEKISAAAKTSPDTAEVVTDRKNFVDVVTTAIGYRLNVSV